VLAQDTDLTKKPVSGREQLFINTLIQNLSTVFRATKHRELVKLEGLRKDMGEFFALPIPKAVWENVRSFQDRSFVRFVEECLGKG
jgi:hypothetical protein